MWDFSFHLRYTVRVENQKLCELVANYVCVNAPYQ